MVDPKPKYYLAFIHPKNVGFVKRVGVKMGTVELPKYGEVEVWDLPSEDTPDE